MSEALRRGRVDKGLTLQEVAEYIGVRRQSVHHWEHAISQPTAEHLDEVCTLYGLDYDTTRSLRNK